MGEGLMNRRRFDKQEKVGGKGRSVELQGEGLRDMEKI